jgi:hypothetical protein
VSEPIAQELPLRTFLRLNERKNLNAACTWGLYRDISHFGIGNENSKRYQCLKTVS